MRAAALALLLTAGGAQAQLLAGPRAETGGVAIGGGVTDSEIYVGAPQADIDEMKASQARVEAMQAELVHKMQRLGEALAAQAAGVSEVAIIELARRVAADVADIDQAMLELERAIEVAIRVQAEGAGGSELGPFVDEVLARVAALSGAGDLDGAAAAAEDGFAQWEREEAERRAAAQAQGLRLLQAGLQQDLLRRDPAAAAAKIAKRVEIETSDPAQRFETLLNHRAEWYERGRSKGLILDLQVSVEVARLVKEWASTATQRGVALNALGVSLWRLGQRTTDRTTLLDAARAHSDALAERPRERAPLEWGESQHGLGNTLLALARREPSTVRLSQAADAFRRALEVRTLDKSLLSWSSSMMSLANTLVEIGQRENNVHYFEEAITLLGRVSEERSRSEDDIRWARARVNMGSALLELGKRTSGRNGLLRLREARAAFEDAATVRSDQATPTDWARARRFEGEAHLYIGLRERTTESLERAVAAFDEALALFDRRETPHDWARTSALKGRALATLAVRKPTASGASTAASHLEAAIEILEAAGYVHEIEELRPQLMAAHAYAERLAAR